MQDQNKRPRSLTIHDLVQAKQDDRPISMVTAYDWWSGCIVDSAGVDCVLVGDSLAMVVAGKPTTLSATIEQMIYHGEIVSRAVQRAIVFVDLPFPLQHLGVDKAIESAARILQETGCQAIKLEGTSGQRDVIAGIVEAGIPVMAHVGLRPQAVHQLGGYRIQRDRDQLLADATAAESAGACGVVLECVPAEMANQQTQLHVELPVRQFLHDRSSVQLWRKALLAYLLPPWQDYLQREHSQRLLNLRYTPTTNHKQ